MKNSRNALFFLVATLAFAPAAGAATDTGNVIVTATVANGCTINAGSVDFGVYDTQAAADNTALGDVTVQCNQGTAGYITLGQGANAFAGSTDAAPDRQMAGTIAGSRLKYGLFQDGAGTVWGNTSGVGGTGVGYVGAAGGAAEAIVIHGTIPALQAAVGGNYIDTVIATITF